MSFGRSVVRSTLGEPLRAEIDILEISEDETRSLSMSVASQKVFAESRFDYHPALLGAQLNLRHRSDGSAYLLITTQDSIADQFVDVIVEGRWAGGQTSRDYALLIANTVAPRMQVAPTMPLVITVPQAVHHSDAPPDKSTPKKLRRPLGNVEPGDTAIQIALSNGRHDVSLDQMLIALLRNNPEAFSNGNLNRLKSGSVLEIPSAADANEISASEASELVLLHSSNFNEFRRNLASMPPVSKENSSVRTAVGRLKSKTTDSRNMSATSDRLTLAPEPPPESSAKPPAMLRNSLSNRSDVGATELKADGQRDSRWSQAKSRLMAEIQTSPTPTSVAGSLIILMVGLLTLQQFFYRREARQKWEAAVVDPSRFATPGKPTSTKIPANDLLSESGIDANSASNTVLQSFTLATEELSDTLNSNETSVPECDSVPENTTLPGSAALAAPPTALSHDNDSVSTQTPKSFIARNGLCPCNSGKKFKICHGKLG